MNFQQRSLFKSIFIAVSLLLQMGVFAQTSDVDKGCAPLTVNFTAPAGSASWFWDFKDGSSSNLQNPSNVFTTAGVYIVEFRITPNGPVTGTVTITVWDKPDVMVTANPESGCTPLQVQFTDASTFSAGIQVLNRSWVFGDGGSAAGIANPAHIYNTAGSFTVSLELTTNYPSCNVTVVFNDKIKTAQKPTANFTTTPVLPQACVPPLNVSFVNTSGGTGPLTYNWNLGNGNTSTLFNPPAQTYTQNGLFPVTLTVTDTVGCTSTKVVNVSVGSPIAVFNPPATVCKGVSFFVQNQSPPGLYSWSFGPNAVPSVSTQYNPIVKFNTGGPQTITLILTVAGGCKDTLTKVVNVDIPDASFAVTPEYSCSAPVLFSFNGLSNEAVSWEWTLPFNDASSIKNPNYLWVNPDTTGYSVNGNVTDSVRLIVTNPSGCRDTVYKEITVWLPNARFVPNIVQGCGPLTVVFADSSYSNEPIVEWQWDFGDGTPLLTQNNGNNVTHTYTQPGEYNVVLMIRNSAGCVDTSYAVLIEVGEMVTGDFTADKLSICPGESVQFTSLVTDPRVDAWHFYSDNNQSWHCPSNQNPSWEHNSAAGLLDVSLMVEYNGCFSTFTKQDYIELKGPIARLHYKTTCDNTLQFEFWDESTGETFITWDLGDGSTSTDSAFTHDYLRGTYRVILTAVNDTSGCPASSDTATVYATQLVAALQIQEEVCQDENTILSALNSQDVNATCYKGYTWYFSFQRPIRTDDPTLNFSYPVNGDQMVWLEVEDINGCKDTIGNGVTVYDRKPDFAISDTTICLPAVVQFTDLSLADTTLVSWIWNFGDGATSTEISPLHTYTQAPLQGGNIYTVQLIVRDTLGCLDTIGHIIHLYKPESNLFVNPTPNICEGQNLVFTGSDYTLQGSNLSWVWNFGEGMDTTGQSVNHTYLTHGTYTVNMVYTEVGSGCKDSTSVQVNVQNYPQAAFTTNVDNLSIICYPQNMQLTNTSTSDYPTGAIWDFGNGQTAFGNTAATVFPKGTWTITMITATSNGCADTTQRSFTVVGPEGNFTIDKNKICKGDEITFSIQDTVDISSFSWSFGDGTGADNISPITHQYNFVPPSGSTVAKLVLRGEDDACSFTLSQPIQFSLVQALFNPAQDPLCFGQAHNFVNNSVDGDLWQWDFGDGSSSTQEAPAHEYDSIGSYTVTLIVTDQPLGCMDTTVQTVTVDGLPNFEAMGTTVCQGDTATISVSEVPGASYTWTPSTGILGASDASSIQIKPNSTTIYTVSVVVDSTGCMDSDTALVFVPGTYTGAMNLDTLVEEGEPVMLSVTLDPNYTFTWTPSDPGSALIVTPIDSSLTYNLTVTDLFGCVESNFLFVVRIFPQNIIAPNVFTPNGDNHNDGFKLIPDGEDGLVTVNYLEIYNRWGQKIFEGSGTDATVIWDGNYKGKPAPVDVYIWKATVTYLTGRTENLVGELTLLR